MSECVEIDGSVGEGGGQVLRSALGLSLVTGKRMRISRIRNSRRKPGLMRQHLTCVRAAQAIGGAEVEGDEISSRDLSFAPSGINPGHYEFAIGTAGSTSLVLQAVLPALLVCEGAWSLRISGGTHNPLAPTFDYLDRVFFPVLRTMGVPIEAKLDGYGFFPIGGGAIEITVESSGRLEPLELMKKKEPFAVEARILLAGLPFDIAARERKVIAKMMGLTEQAIPVQTIENSQSTGNLVIVEGRSGNISEMATSHAKRGKRAEDVAKAACREFRHYQRLRVPVGQYLADQLLIPLALAGGGRFLTHEPSSHTLTNAQVIEAFLPCRFQFEDRGEGRFEVICSPS